MSLTIEQLEAEINYLISIYKDFDDRGELKLKKKDGKYVYPEFYEGYNKLVNDHEDIRVHAERCDFPERLFVEKSPNISEKELAYLKANYKNVTQPIFVDFLSSIGRAFNDGNWSLNFEPSEDPKSFENYEAKHHITGYVRDILLPQKLRDPNGVVCIKPDYKVMYDDEGNSFVDDKEYIEPRPYYYSVIDVWAYEKDYVIVHSDEKSLVQYGNDTKKMGHVFEVYDKNNIWEVRQTGKYVDWEFEYTLYYQHDLGKVPAKRLMGIPYLAKNKVHYVSPFLYAVDNLDLVTINENNKQVSLQLTMYPIRVMVGETCDYEQDGARCNNGTLMVWDGDVQRTTTCPECHGSGMTKNPNRMSTILVSNKTGFDNEQIIKPNEALAFVQPDTSGLEFVDKDVQNHEMRARQILHLQQSTSEVKGNDQVAETATGKRLDMDQQYSFIKPIADQTFDLFYDILEIIEKMRYNVEEVTFSLSPPITYDFRTREDLLNEIDQAVKIGEPSLINKAVYEYIRQQYYTDEQTIDAFTLIRRADRLFGLSKEQVSAMIGRGAVERWEEELHYSSLFILNSLIREDENFLALEVDQQIESMQSKAREIADSVNIENEDTTEALVNRLSGQV